MVERRTSIREIVAQADLPSGPAFDSAGLAHVVRFAEGAVTARLPAIGFVRFLERRASDRDARYFRK